MQTECYTRLVTHRRTCTQPRLRTSSAGRKKKKCAWWPRCALLNTHILPAAQYKYIYARMDFLGGFCNLKGCLENYLSKWAKVDPPPSSTTWECVGSWSHNTGREHFVATFTSQALILLITQLLLIKLVNAGLSPSIIECFSQYCYFYLSAGSEKKKKTSSLTLIKPPTCSVRQSFSSTK